MDKLILSWKGVTLEKIHVVKLGHYALFIFNRACGYNTLLLRNSSSLDSSRLSLGIYLVAFVFASFSSLPLSTRLLCSPFFWLLYLSPDSSRLSIRLYPYLLSTLRILYRRKQNEHREKYADGSREMDDSLLRSHISRELETRWKICATIFLSPFSTSCPDSRDSQSRYFSLVCFVEQTDSHVYLSSSNCDTRWQNIEEHSAARWG